MHMVQVGKRRHCVMLAGGKEGMKEHLKKGKQGPSVLGGTVSKRLKRQRISLYVCTNIWSNYSVFIHTMYSVRLRYEGENQI